MQGGTFLITDPEKLTPRFGDLETSLRFSPHYPGMFSCSGHGLPAHFFSNAHIDEAIQPGEPSAGDTNPERRLTNVDAQGCRRPACRDAATKLRDASSPADPGYPELNVSASEARDCACANGLANYRRGLRLAGLPE